MEWMPSILSHMSDISKIEKVPQYPNFAEQNSLIKWNKPSTNVFNVGSLWDAVISANKGMNDV